MAGAGYKLFVSGDVLTAAQVNTYLQEQSVMVFASSAARTTALSGVLAEGMISYLSDTNKVEFYDGAAWVGLNPNAVTYTPTWTGSTTNPAIGNGTITGRYFRIGNFISYQIAITMGSTTTYGSGRYQFGLPVTSGSTTYNHHAYALILDNGVSWYYGYLGDALSFGTTSSIELRNGAGTVVSSTAPFTFGNTDAIYIVGQYVI